MEKQEMIQKTAAKDILDSFVISYAERDRSMVFSGWLGDKLRQEIPDMSEETCTRLAGEIIGAVADYEKRLREINEALDAGQSREGWFAGQLAKVYEAMPLDMAGERLLQIEDDLAASNMLLMQGIDSGRAEAVELEEADGNPIEWSDYSVKNKAYEIGNQLILTGIAAAANVLKERAQSDEAVDVGGVVAETFQEGLKRDSAEVKAVVAGAVKVVAERGLTELLPRDTSVGEISDMAGAAVESADALFDAANGKSTMLDAMDRIGRASVAAGCGYVSDALRRGLAKIPYVGPIVVDLAGGLLNYMKGSVFSENVYAVVRDTAAATWEGIKESRVGRAVHKVGKLVKKIFS